MSKCKGCGQDIIWAKTKNMKNMPLDKKPISVVQVREGIAEVIQAHMPHWATCQKASDFKRG